MSQTISIPVGADTSGFYRELKKAFDWAKKESSQISSNFMDGVQGSSYGGYGGGSNAKNGGFGNKINQTITARMPDPTRAGLHELGNGGFIRTFESQMATAGYIAVKTQELIGKASLRGIRDWASGLSSGVKNIISPLASGTMAIAKGSYGLAKMGGESVGGLIPKSRFKGSGLSYPIASLLPEPPEEPPPNPLINRFHKLYPNAQGIFGNNRDRNKNNNLMREASLLTIAPPRFTYPDSVRPYDARPLNLDQYAQNLADSRQPRNELGQFMPRNVVPRILPSPSGTPSLISPTPSSGGGNRGGNSSYLSQPRDERGRFMPFSASRNNPIGGDRGYKISSNTVNITANTVYITTGSIVQGNGSFGGNGSGGSGGNNSGTGTRTPMGRPPGISSQITPTIPLNTTTPVVPKPRKPIQPLLFFEGSPQNPSINPQKKERIKMRKDPLDIAGRSIADEIFNPTSQRKHGTTPSLGDRVREGAGRLANGAGQVVSGVKGVAGAAMGTMGAALGIAGIGFVIASQLAGVVSDIGEKYVGQAMKQSDTIGALGGRVGGGGGYFVNEEVARANVAKARITGDSVYGKGNKVDQYEMKFASSMGVGLSEMSGMLSHIKHAEGEAASIDKIRRKAASMGFTNLKMLTFLQKETEYAQQRTDQGLKSDFDDVLKLGKAAFGDLKPEGRIQASEQMANTVAPRFGTNILSDMMLSKKMMMSGDGSAEGMLKAAQSLERNKSGNLLEFVESQTKDQRVGTATGMYTQGHWTPSQALAYANYDPDNKKAVEKEFAKSNKESGDPAVRAMQNFFAAHENRQQAMFLNGIGAKAYQLSVDLQKQQMDMVKQNEQAFLDTAKNVAKMQQEILGATGKMIKFTTDVINTVDEFLKEKDGFIDKVKNFWKNLGDSLAKSSATNGGSFK